MHSATTASPDAVKAELENKFPGWRVLRSDKGRWWALRGPLPLDRINEVDTVDCGTPDELTARLAHLTDGTPS